MQGLSRRDVIRRAALAIVGGRFVQGVATLGTAGMIVGCNEQQWFQIVGALLPIIGNTYLQFYGFAKGGVDAGDIALVRNLTTAGQDIISKVGNYLSTYEANKDAGTLVEIKTLLTQGQNDIDGFLTDAQIKNSAKFAQYSAFAHALLADIADVVALVPIVLPPSQARYGQKTVVETAKLSQAKALKAVFEARLSSLPKS